jgi:hypothetical protein
MCATQDAKREILIGLDNAMISEGCRWLMTKRPWTVEDS